MGSSYTGAPEFFKEGGKLNRRTFIKGAGLVTIASAMGFGINPIGAVAEETPAGSGERTVHAVCTVNCTSRCHLKGTVCDDRLIRVEPGDMPGRPDYANACLRSMSYIQRMQDENARVMWPMKRIGERGEGKFERITWDEAIDTIAEKLNKTIAEKGPAAASFYSFTGNLGKLSWEAPTRFAATLGATTWDIEGIMGDHGASMGLNLVYGQQRGAHDSRDYMNSKMLVLWGRNVADTHTSELADYIKAHENGAKVVVIDPRQCSSCAFADQWIPINPQTDPALALGMMNIIISNNLHDKNWIANASSGPFLVRYDDGQLLRNDQGTILVWDSVSNAPVPLGTDGAKPAITGSYNVAGMACKPAFEHLMAEVEKYTLEKTAEITGISQDVIQTFAMEYINAKPAGIRMGQGMQRVNCSYSPFRTVATLAGIAGYIGVKGGGASHAGGTATTKPVAGYTGPVYNYSNWSATGKKENQIRSSKLYDAASLGDPVSIDFFWIANSNFINMSPDSNRIVNEVIPAIDFIVTVDPWWTWTTKYSDIVLPGSTYWEKWDIIDRSPWVMFNQPAIQPMGESKSDVEIMSLLAKKCGVEQYWEKTDEEWIREFVTTDHPAWADFDWQRDVVDQGIYGRADADYSPAIVFADQVFKTKSKKFEFYTENLWEFGEEVPTWQRPAEDPREGELAEKYPLVFIQYHDRLNVHTQHILNPALTIVQDEPLLQMNPADAEKRGIKHGDIAFVHNDRGFMKIRVFLTEGIIPGTVATQSGWTPDYFIEGEYQTLTRLELNEVEESISMTNTAFYDVLVQVEKA